MRAGTGAKTKGPEPGAAQKASPLPVLSEKGDTEGLEGQGTKGGGGI